MCLRRIWLSFKMYEGKYEFVHSFASLEVPRCVLWNGSNMNNAYKLLLRGTMIHCPSEKCKLDSKKPLSIFLSVLHGLLVLSVSLTCFACLTSRPVHFHTAFVCFTILDSQLQGQWKVMAVNEECTHRWEMADPLRMVDISYASGISSSTKLERVNTITVLLEDSLWHIFLLQISIKDFAIKSCFSAAMVFFFHVLYILTSVELILKAAPNLKMKIRKHTAHSYHDLHILLPFCEWCSLQREILLVPNCLQSAVN